MTRKTLLASALALALATPAFAADDAAATTAGDDALATLDAVQVSASTSRLPFSEAAMPNTITVIDRAQLEQQLALTRDLSQVLANLVPAFAPSRQKMTSFGESLRGRQPLYLVDGVPQSTPLRDGSRDAHTIDPALIERIEVIHGANALQGLGASGGIINIITKRAHDPALAFSSEIGVRSGLRHSDDHDLRVAQSVSGGSEAVRGTVEQNVIYHLIVQATPALRGQLCATGHCNADGVPVDLPRTAATPLNHQAQYCGYGSQWRTRAQASGRFCCSQ